MRTRIKSHLYAATAAAVVCLLLLCSLSAESADCTPIEITVQPQSLALEEGCPAIFAVSLTGSGPYFYQWWRDDKPVPDETNSTYTIAISRIFDNGTRVRVAITNGCSQITSDDALLYILRDVVPPRLLRARGDATLERVIVTFAVGACGWPGLYACSAQDLLNYSFSGGIIASNALLDGSGTNVILTTSPLTPGTIYTLTVNDVADLNGNTIPAGSETKLQAWVIVPGSDPPAIVPPPVKISRSGMTNSITWPHGSLLQHTDRISRPWNTLSEAPNPYRPASTNAAGFFRAYFYP
jgi:hypothetical protein